MLSIKPTVYRWQQGFLIYGSREHRGISIFTRTRKAAERIKEKKLRGEEITVEDFRDGN